MAQPIDWTHLFEKYRGKWVALADDEVTVLGSSATAKEAHAAIAQNLRGLAKFVARPPPQAMACVA
jgi:hypothetical protein